HRALSEHKTLSISWSHYPCAAPSAKGDDKFITTDYLQQCPLMLHCTR
ncbi:TPA_asm: hypothetical protein G4J43_004977, partial [Salmonella enterica subsp. enterica serovar Typhimurium]|nr:hypothetical protein [Salmonella enterica subsp. enterica serovar Typhimurium]HAE3339475.1 hypothetical protein [Salmonella enterica subsp. enterica serovar Typhimurium]HAE6106878.1 hypothetical protein [Salmonella enterica subsp. enterica serovar Typhimurium]HAF7825753.1 hypothetical protein [Salmonella enterica subsp. enterica serovar Typhimurium]